MDSPDVLVLDCMLSTSIGLSILWPLIICELLRTWCLSSLGVSGGFNGEVSLSLGCDGSLVVVEFEGLFRLYSRAARQKTLIMRRRILFESAIAHVYLGNTVCLVRLGLNTHREESLEYSRHLVLTELCLAGQNSGPLPLVSRKSLVTSWSPLW